jgi:DnaJ-domain-containing protein 1
MTFHELMQAYEKAAEAYHRTRFGTQANEKAGKRLAKACKALEQYRANNPQG